MERHRFENSGVARRRRRLSLPLGDPESCSVERHDASCFATHPCQHPCERNGLSHRRATHAVAATIRATRGPDKREKIAKKVVANHFDVSRVELDLRRCESAQVTFRQSVRRTGHCQQSAKPAECGRFDGVGDLADVRVTTTIGCPSSRAGRLKPGGSPLTRIGRQCHHTTQTALISRRPDGARSPERKLREIPFGTRGK